MALLFVTVNLGSVPVLSEGQRNALTERLLEIIRPKDIDFVAIHFQEISGKHTQPLPDETMNLIKRFLRDAMSLGFYRGVVFLDGLDPASNHTGLGSLYLARPRISVQQHSFKSNTFFELDGIKVYCNGLAKCEWIIKHKFEYLNIACRKGALRSRWLFFGKYALDLLNVHLINEKDNISSIRRFPTTTLEARKRNLAMELLSINGSPSVLFGDFNFRINQPKLINFLLENYVSRKYNVRECKIDKYVDDAKVVIRDTKEDVTLLSVGRKFFHLGLLLKQHFMQNLETIRQFDEEPFAFSSDLHELPVMFPPTYPFDDLTNEFSGSRCPAWCDRIFLSKSAMALLPIETSEYNSIRCEVSTGDHKPVYLRLDLNIFVSPRSEDHLPRISISINGNPVSVDDAFTMAWR